MLLSCVLQLRACQDAVLPFTGGRAIHAAFLQLVNNLNPGLNAKLHETARVKSFTTSPLFGDMEKVADGFHLEAEQEYWLRFTSLDATLSALLLNLEARDIGHITLLDAKFSVQQVLTKRQAHPWSGVESYESLAERWLGSDGIPPRKIGLRFVSPTTFRTGGRNTPFPLPHLVFLSLAEKWRQFAPASLGQEVGNFLDELSVTGEAAAEKVSRKRGTWERLDEIVCLSHYSLHTRTGDFQGFKQVGFVGTVEFELGAEIADRWARLLQLLADFSFYAGVGFKTTMGMGQTQRKRGGGTSDHNNSSVEANDGEQTRANK